MATDYCDDILSRGFTVISGFLTQEEVAAFAADFGRQARSEGRAYSLGIASATVVDAIRPRLRGVLDAIATRGTFTPRHIGGGAYFATENGIDFRWHQDHESFFINQTHQNYLNVYIPVIKPQREKSNLSLIPADAFRDRCPDLWKRLQWGGAVSTAWRDGKTWLADDWRGGLHGTLDFPLDDLAVTPLLAAGDALLMRGDLFHQTQDTETRRVSLSIRAWDERQVVTKAHFETTCAAKNWYMEKNPRPYAAIAEVFAERPELPLAELMAKVYARRVETALSADQSAPAV